MDCIRETKIITDKSEQMLKLLDIKQNILFQPVKSEILKLFPGIIEDLPFEFGVSDGFLKVLDKVPPISLIISFSSKDCIEQSAFYSKLMEYMRAGGLGLDAGSGDEKKYQWLYDYIKRSLPKYLNKPVDYIEGRALLDVFEEILDKSRGQLEAARVEGYAVGSWCIGVREKSKLPMRVGKYGPEILQKLPGLFRLARLPFVN